MDDQAIMYLVFCMLPILIVLVGSSALGILSTVAILFAIATAVFIMMLNWVDYMVFPAVMRTLGIEFRLAKEYAVNKSQDAIIKNVNGLNYATGYLTANLFSYVFKAEVPEEDMDQKIADAPERWERALMGIDFPFKFHVISCNRDVQKARDFLEGKRSYMEFQMNRAVQSGKSSDTELSEMRRKLNTLQAQMDRISEGEKPISTIMYVESVAVGVTRDAALSALSGQLERLETALSSLDVQIQRVVGRELTTLFSFNFTLPANYTAASSYFDMQG